MTIKDETTAGRRRPAVNSPQQGLIGDRGTVGMFLTDKEVCALTGYSRQSAQIRWLRAHGWRFTVNALGKPVVAVAEFNRHMVGSGAARSAMHQEPDWAAINVPASGVKRNGTQAQA
jgi:uncharacterized protein DUF4224